MDTISLNVSLGVCFDFLVTDLRSQSYKWQQQGKLSMGTMLAISPPIAFKNT